MPAGGVFETLAYFVKKILVFVCKGKFLRTSEKGNINQTKMSKCQFYLFLSGRNFTYFDLVCHLRHSYNLRNEFCETLTKHTDRFTNIGKLNFPMVVRFLAWTDFQCCPSCLQKYCSIQKWSKLTPKESFCFINLNHKHTLTHTL